MCFLIFFMKSVLLDTSFILTAIRQKIDFFEEFSLKGLKILIPEKVIKELKSIASTKKGKAKQEARLALKIIQINNFESIKIKGRNADKAIIKYSKENPDVLIATLDREIKNKVMGKKLIIKGKRKLETL